MAQVLICGAAIVTLSMGIRHGFGLWLQPITQDMGWTRQTFALAMALSLGATRHRKPLVWLAWIAAIGIAWSRVHLGVHFASDLMAGALVGISGALIVWHIAFQLRRRRHLRVVPHLKRLRSAWAAQG